MPTPSKAASRSDAASPGATATKTPRHLSDPAVMLETLKLAYQSVLDNGCFTTPEGTPLPKGPKRLTAAQGRELGRRLARYWLMDDPAKPPITKEELDEVVDQVTEAAQKAWQAVTNAADKVARRLDKHR